MFMGRKRFINRSAYDVEVQLGVRRGNMPGEIKEVKSFDLCHDAEIVVDYGDEKNPYVDQITVKGVCAGSMTQETLTVLDKSSALDDMFNCNDTVQISYDECVFQLEFRNTWTV
jgi:hypothetical protein